MLVLGSEVMAGSFDAQYQAAATSASRKIEAVLGQDVQKDVAYFKENVRFISMDSKVLADVPETLRQVRRAILGQKSLHLNYFKRAEDHRGELSERTVDPHGLIHFDGMWMLSAYCHMRRAMRMFRLERVRHVTVLAETFTRQPDFGIHKLYEFQTQMAVELLFDPDVAQWVRERPAHYPSVYEDTPEGLRVTVKVRQPSEIMGWVLGWGAKVRVLSPESLRVRLKGELEATLKIY